MESTPTCSNFRPARTKRPPTKDDRRILAVGRAIHIGWVAWVEVAHVNGADVVFMNRYAVLVDVGYLYAAAGETLLGATTRHEYRVDAEGLIRTLMDHAAERVRGELLRVYWFYSARDRVPTVDQRVIAQMP